MGLFNGLTIDVADNTATLDLADVKWEFNMDLNQISTLETDFNKLSDSMDLAEKIYNSVKSSGRLDESVASVLKNSGNFFESLGISVSLENYDPEMTGTEVCLALEGAEEGFFGSILNFFKNIWDGIKNFFKSMLGIETGTAAKLNAIEKNNAAVVDRFNVKDGVTAGSQKLSGKNLSGIIECGTRSAVEAKITSLSNVLDYLKGCSDIKKAVAFIQNSNSATELSKHLTSYGYTVKTDKDGNIEVTRDQATPMWQPGEIETGASGETLVSVFAKAGWTANDFAPNSTLRNLYNKCLENIKKTEEITKVIEPISNANSVDNMKTILGDSLGKDNANNLNQKAVESLRSVAKLILACVSVAGKEMAFITQLVSDAYNIANGKNNDITPIAPEKK